MPKRTVFAENAPNPMPEVFPQAIVANGLVFCSGNIAMDESNKIIDGDVKAHTVSGHAISRGDGVKDVAASNNQEPLSGSQGRWLELGQNCQDQHLLGRLWGLQPGQ